MMKSGFCVVLILLILSVSGVYSQEVPPTGEEIAPAPEYIEVFAGEVGENDVVAAPAVSGEENLTTEDISLEDTPIDTIQDAISEETANLVDTSSIDVTDESSSNLKIILISVIILIMLILAGIGVYFLILKKNVPETSSVPLETQNVSPE